MMKTTVRHTTMGIGFGLAAAGVLAVACSSADGSRLDSSGAGADNGSGSSQGGFGFTSGNGAGGGGEEGCVGITAKAEPGDANLYIIVDKSGSMLSNNKWSNAENAFDQFFVDPSADPLNVALRFWPDAHMGACGEPSGSCASNAVQACAMPEVPLGSLADPNHEQALIASFAAHDPNGLTPMSVALQGGIEWARAQQQSAEATDVFAVVLLTDGEPTDCDTNINNIANIAASGYNNDGILTFAVGLQGSSEQQLNQIAAAGGTQQGYFIGNNSTQELINAMKAIAASVVDCIFAMPDDPAPDKPIDPNQVNVLYNGSKLGKVPSQADCGAGGGWYYDNNADPTAILLCPNTCQTIQADSMASIDIEIGCGSIIQ